MPVYWPALRMERVTTVAADTWTPSATLRWPSTMAPPPKVQLAPMVALPATPTQPAIAVLRPTRTLWPIWIRLSSFTPSSSTVSSSAPRSMQVLAPISTSLPMRTAPSCSILTLSLIHI